ncbi:MAG: hypothetical protein ACREJD_04490 [Phycisphaerales bacterium]
MASNPTQPPIDAEAQAGDQLPDPVLAPRALAELREAFGPSLEVSHEADARVLHSLNAHRRKTAHNAGFWRGFQIAAVLALAATFMLFMNSRNKQLAAESAFARVAAAEKEKKKLEADRTLASAAETASPAAAASNVPSAAPHTEAKFASAVPANPTILDVLNLARKAERSPASFAQKSPGFKSSGVRVSEFDEVNRIAAQVVGAEPDQTSALDGRLADSANKDDASGFAPAEFESRRDALRAAAPAAPLAVSETRILTYDIMLDVGSRSLAAFQIEISMSAPDTVRVTGTLIRGGDHPALQRQPLFDNKRVSRPGARTTFTIANFDTGKDLPSGDVRVARIVLIVVGPGNPGVTARLVIAAGAEGVPIPAGLRVVERAPMNDADIKHKALEKAAEEAEAQPAAK